MTNISPKVLYIFATLHLNKWIFLEYNILVLGEFVVFNVSSAKLLV